MATNTLYPAFGVAEYTSAFGNHKQTIPTAAWNAGIGTNGFGGYVGWDTTTPNDAEDMWTDLLTLEAAFMPPATSFNVVTIYTVPTVNGIPQPQVIIPLSIVGTNMSTNQSKAVQQTFNMRTVAFGKFKLVMLDSIIGANWEKVLAANFGAPDLALVGALTDQSKAWSGRDNTAPAAAISKTLTLNDKLRKEYGMS